MKISEMRTQNESFPTISNLRRPQTLWKVENRDRETQTGGKGNYFYDFFCDFLLIISGMHPKPNPKAPNPGGDLIPTYN
ncbi:hypothetical protein COLO4_31989 [Corchorus olitorius]|uniref:Uncharacterized protein n=1 Tax=Corchorus olitorius TaxID=93759 RepID=A0A1R3H2N0_9ROSI|nr:hypothetical protein COLO4_31989 [Corchorus olitorius]